MFRPHLMQGWSPDFISGLTEKALAEGLVDEIVPVNGNEAMRLARELATQGGHLRRHLERRHARRRARRGAARAATAAASSACCPTPASATCRRRCSRASTST